MNSNWTRFNKYLYKYWKVQALVILLGLITLPLALINPYLTKLVIDKAYVNKDMRLFIILAVIGGSIFVLGALLSSLKNYLSQRIKYSVHLDLAKDTFRKLQELSLSFYNDKSTGEHIFKISNDVDSVTSFICDFMPSLVTLLPRLLFILIIVFYLNFKLALMALFLLPVTLLHPYFFGKWLREITRRLTDKFQIVFKNLGEVFSHMRLIKALGKEDYEIARFEEGYSERIRFEIKKTKHRNISNFSRSFINKFIGGIIALYGGYEVIRGRLSLGSLTAVMIYLSQLIWSVKEIGGFYESLAIGSVSCRRLCEVLDRRAEIEDKDNALDFIFREAEIDFRDVWFGYKKGEYIFRGISFPVKPASKIAIVGPSGCGKTTLLSLVLRLYDLERGSIMIDGIDIRDVRLKMLKSQIGIALQEPFLWNDTISNNILYGAINADEREMIAAAKLAEADSFIAAFPKKYDSIIGELACKISQGQKQRIAIARAVIKRPKILILDEAFASVDSQIEDKIMDNIMREFRASTVIVVSHRLSTVKKMDSVYYLESPCKMAVGTHDEFTEKEPKYRELFASQIEDILINGRKA